ncbi:DUF1501 domain-containing protein [Primorskyibacter aestuariivivens]|uniref:DUF1501 domain-containing protein n=1 Tax=Primorskyibacter aestuariivivens TaxID=1888912 RepID=UPI0023005BCE|nr:DUF1501 domain-containing protein [Primorskyibacter aestuariivivens]MDA7429604.1 DUF1501 domain-containing protein [Primorskyibacter aestuariivivens]
MTLSRRSVLLKSLALGCTAAASPFVTPVSFASAPWDNRLVVILLRGGMDGLDVVRPVGDRDFARLRSGTGDNHAEQSVDLDGFFAAHPSVNSLMPLWSAEELGFVHAVSTPYRGKRSHFDGQDMLEAGTGQAVGSRLRNGWLNRLLQVVGVEDAQTAFALGHDNQIVLSGQAPYSRWSPDANLNVSPQTMALAKSIMSGDPMLASALEQAQELAMGELSGAVVPEIDENGRPVGREPGMNGSMDMQAARPKLDSSGHVALARYAGWQLSGSARIAAFSLNGWDTHRRQDVALPRSVTKLADILIALKEELGPIWDRTAVLAVTEFGRTVRLNGTKGTDHGTGGAMLFAGGALNGGRVVSDWPGLAERDLYEGRDLMPTRDLRAHAAWVIRDLFGLSVDDLERSVFPGLDMGPRSGLLI